MAVACVTEINAYTLTGSSYVADFDPLCGLALVTTTSRPRSQYVRDFMDTYLAFRTYLGVRISVSTFRLFTYV